MDLIVAPELVERTGCNARYSLGGHADGHENRQVAPLLPVHGEGPSPKQLIQNRDQKGSTQRPAAEPFGIKSKAGSGKSTPGK
jgi:hypothetical protein